MAHFAEIDADNTVLRVIVVNDEDTADSGGIETDPIGEAFCNNLLDGSWKRTSYNGNYRVRFAGVGSTFDAGRDAFISPQPFPSWTIDDATVDWTAPTPMPDDDKPYLWDEGTLSWVALTPPE